MRPQQTAWRVSSFIACLIALVIGTNVVACAAAGPVSSLPTSSTPPVTSPAGEVPTASANATATRSVPTRTPIATTSAVTLTLWTTEDLAPGTTPAGRVLRNQYDAFTAANPNIHIDVVLKKPSGKGGLLDFLLTTSTVVPSQLPDLITLDISEVPLAAEAGALQSLDIWLAADLTNDLFPFASKAGRYQNQWIAVPFVADAQHFVYNKTVVKKPAQTWDDLIKQKTPMLLPLGGDDAFILQYAAIAPSGDITAQLDSRTVTEVLSFFKRTHDLSLLNDVSIGIKSDEAWSAFAAGQAPLAQVAASRYLTEREKVPNAQFAPVPTRDGKTATVASGWAFAVTTNDPVRQAASARFIQWIVQGERLAPWLRAAHRLPAARSAIFLAVDPPDYATFLRDELERATYVPRTLAFVKASEAWHTAVTNVWKGQTTPEEAARGVTGTLK